MKLVHGFQFPDADEFMVKEIDANGDYQITHLTRALEFVTDWSCALDCGAHVGTWSKRLSEKFARVVAIEPSLDTFEALIANMRAFHCDNVTAHNVACGSSPGRIAMQLSEDQAKLKNTGARFAGDGDDVPMITIDSLALPSLGFLKLDVEGSEPMALRGAKDTLRRCRPIVLFENKWLWTRHFGLPKDAVAKFLQGAGYRFVESVARDQIWAAR